MTHLIGAPPILFDTQTPTITNGGYSAGDTVGGLLTFQIGSGYGFRGGLIRKLEVVDQTHVNAALRFHIFTAKPTVLADNAPLLSGLSAADLLHEIGIITVASGDYVTFGTPSRASENNIDLDFTFEPDQQAGVLYAYAECTATPTYVNTSGLTFKLEVYGAK